MSETTTEANSPAAGPAEDPTPFGWLNTADHKRIGRLFVIKAVMFLALGAVLDLLIRIDLTDNSDFVVLDGQTFAQVFAMSREVLVLLFLVPVFLGLAMYVVPLQIGASNLAFPRAAALSFWGWLVSAGVLLGAYLGNGGPYGGWSDGVDLHLLALGGLVVSLLIGAIAVAATVLTMRSPGLYLDRTPPFSWSALVTASMLVISLPVLLGQLTIIYIDHRYGTLFLGGNYGVWERIDWIHRTPQLFIYAVPVLGVVAEVVLSASRRRIFEPLAMYFTIGLVGLFGFGAWANFSVTGEGLDIIDGVEGVILVGLYAGALLGSTVLLLVLGFTLFQGRKGLKLNSAVLAALCAGLMVKVGAAVGLIGAGIDWLELGGRGNGDNPYLSFTTWVTANQSVLIYGAGLLGVLAALHWWAPKIWGRRLNEGLGMLSVLLAFVGATLAMVGPALSGLLTDQPDFDYADPNATSLYSGALDDSGAETWSTLGAAGVAVALAGLVLLLLNLVVSILLKKGAVAESDPWSAQTPEWLLESPPPLGQSNELAEITSGTPLLDAAEADAEEVTV
ncbi:MAG: cbb3-type cytochrome c oxidase subunit I [Actinomycetota bacterium]|jgi:cytochrome c oxidase subunit I|nr:cbb3-type cytochrome c oxidase subunit I [Actinomycetota bacterium]